MEFSLASFQCVDTCHKTKKSVLKVIKPKCISSILITSINMIYFEIHLDFENNLASCISISMLGDFNELWLFPFKILPSGTYSSDFCFLNLIFLLWLRRGVSMFILELNVRGIVAARSSIPLFKLS